MIVWNFPCVFSDCLKLHKPPMYQLRTFYITCNSRRKHAVTKKISFMPSFNQQLVWILRKTCPLHLCVCSIIWEMGWAYLQVSSRHVSQVSLSFLSNRYLSCFQDDRPFTCHMCPYKTGVKGNLTKHLRSMHHIEVTTHQVRVTPCCQGCQTTPVTATDSTSTTSVEEVSSDITGVSMTSDILTPVMISSSAELMRLDSTVFGSDDLLRQSDDI